jgi:hypothetical protein
MVAHSLGRVGQALARGAQRVRTEHRAGAQPVPTEHRAGAEGVPAEDGHDFLSGASGTVGGLDGVRRGLLDTFVDARELASGRRLRLARAARRWPAQRRVLVLSVVRPRHEALAEAAHRELMRSRHAVELVARPDGGRGKFENLNVMLAEHPADGHDWLLVLDDDVALPRGFLDRLLFLSERFGLLLTQPAHRLRSHAAWEVTRRRAGSAVRETAFVEIGPVTAFAAATFPVLLPFPPLRMGWGLDVHWAALAREHGWRCGVLDAVAIRHGAAPAASAYSGQEAVREAMSFLASRPYVTAGEAQRTLATHRRW